MGADGDVELAFQALKAKFESIRLVNGYKNDIVRVYRTFRALDNLDSIEAPAVLIRRNPGGAEQFLPLDERGYKITIPVTALAYAKRGAENAESDQAASKAEALRSDLIKLAMSDPHWGTSQEGSGSIKNSKIIVANVEHDWDDAGVYAEMSFEFYMVIDGTNP